MDSVTVGVNWYWRSNFKFMLNYVMVRPGSTARAAPYRRQPEHPRSPPAVLLVIEAPLSGTPSGARRKPRPFLWPCQGPHARRSLNSSRHVHRCHLSEIFVTPRCHRTVMECARERATPVVSLQEPFRDQVPQVPPRRAGRRDRVRRSQRRCAADVTGAGASFVYPVMSKWSADYAKTTGKKVNYQSIGSGGGIAQIKAATVDFGSSDAPLKPEELAKHGLAQFPSVIGGVVPVINVPGVASGALKLDGETLANIFLGKVTKWNDPAIVAAQRRRAAARQQDHRRAPLGRFGHHLQLRQLPVQGQPGVEDQGRRRHRGEVADRHRRQGQRGRRRLRQADQGRHRLRRTVLRAAEQDGLLAPEERRRQLRAAVATTPSRPPPPTPTGPTPRTSTW